MKRLDWKHINVGSEFRKMAKLRDLRIEEFGFIPDPQLRQIDNQIQHLVNTEVNRIWDGRLACYLARNNTKVFKVYCIADFDIRAQRLASRGKISLEAAKRKVLARDIEEANVFKRLYGFSDPGNKTWVNLRLNTSYNTPEELVEMVLQALSIRKSSIH